MFAVAVSLVSGKILYISNQVASIFHCKKDAFSDAKFVEFLAPHDVSVFHSYTTPYKLPPWSVCSGLGEVLAAASDPLSHTVWRRLVARAEVANRASLLSCARTTHGSPPDRLPATDLSRARGKQLFVSIINSLFVNFRESSTLGILEMELFRGALT